jgi:GT2 family glycosyltransferase
MKASVLIPTWRRPDTLPRCLRHLYAQRGAPEFEIVVGVDAEDDPSLPWLRAEADRAPRRLLVLPGAHRGQAAALNRALRASAGEIAIVIGDDILVEPDFVREHLRAHEAHPGPEVAVQGKAPWHPEILPDRFVEWLDREGILFAFSRMRENDWNHTRFLYTCNVSFRRDWLLEAGAFDEELTCWLDTELGYRAAKRGLRLWYHPAALGWHLDRWTPDRVRRRRYEKGRIAVGLLRREPDFSRHVTLPLPTPWRTVRYGLSRAVRGAAERLGPPSLRGWCWIHYVNAGFAEGFREESRRWKERDVPSERSS